MKTRWKIQDFLAVPVPSERVTRGLLESFIFNFLMKILFKRQSCVRKNDLPRREPAAASSVCFGAVKDSMRHLI